MYYKVMDKAFAKTDSRAIWKQLASHRTNVKTGVDFWEELTDSWIEWWCLLVSPHTPDGGPCPLGWTHVTVAAAVSWLDSLFFITVPTFHWESFSETGLYLSVFYSHPLELRSWPCLLSPYSYCICWLLQFFPTLDASHDPCPAPEIISIKSQCSLDCASCLLRSTE